jgi:uncharacterized circularly permuted ATP-grasp superfamily protein
MRWSRNCAPGRRRNWGQRQLEADWGVLTQGITFTVYGDTEGTERIFPFDLVPRIITASEWRDLERGLAQRLTAVNLFLKDVITTRGFSPWASCPATWCRAATLPPRNARRARPSRHLRLGGGHRSGSAPGRPVWCWKTTCAPSGVSYMLANREVTKRVLPGLFDRYRVSPISHYGQALLATLRAPPPGRGRSDVRRADARVGNSVYFEHAFLAREMGVALVEGRDLLVHDNIVYMRTTAGPGVST